MPLDRQTILHHAFCQLNEAGLENLTLRRLAARVGVQAPALYWHFKNKQELLDEMATQVFREALKEGPDIHSAQAWRDWAVEYGKGLRRILLRYREGAKMFSGTYLTDATLYAPMEASLRKLTDAGFSLRDAVVGLGTLYSYTVGFVIEEQAVFPEPVAPNSTRSAEAKPDAHYDLARRGGRIDKSLYPLVYAAGAELFGDHDARFKAGLDVVVNGMAAALPRSPASV
jgi:TetR/AcrR family transcriptional regulator, tetracycline repressor protein